MIEKGPEEQCQRCNELWQECAMVTAEVSRRSKLVERAAVKTPAKLPDAVKRLHAAVADRAAVQTKIKIHLALSHPGDIGRGAARAATEFMPV